jgi:hypothetical protein
MPWCEPCEKNWTPTSLRSDGTCPDCGEHVEVAEGGGQESRPYKTPWHFWVGVGVAAIYLGWRAVQGIMLLF